MDKGLICIKRVKGEEVLRQHLWKQALRDYAVGGIYGPGIAR